MNHRNTLKTFFGYENFKPDQEEIINSISNGANVLAVLPTGAGKSLCYQIPALSSNTFAIVVSPLIALMKDQVDSLNNKNHIAAFINSSLDFNETEKVLYEIHKGKLKLLYVSPEKLSNLLFAEKLKNLQPQYLFVDEAHCISEWGHNFRPSYRKINEFKNFIGIEKISAFTATATPEVQKDILKQLEMVNPSVFVSGFARKNLSLNVTHTKHKKEKVLELLKSSETPAIVYAATRKNAEELTEYLKFQKFRTEYYHAGLTTELRKVLQDDFQKENFDVIVATNAFGMGIDKGNIRTIVHYNMPGSIENYYQEIGRAGRDGLDSEVHLLFELKDKYTQEYFLSNSFPTREEIFDVYELLNNYGKVALGNLPDEPIIIDEKFQIMLNQKSISSLKFNSILTVLQDTDFIEQQSQLSRRFRIKFRISNKELKTYVDKLINAKLKNVILIMLRLYGANLFINKTNIDPFNIARKIGISRDEVVEQFHTLNNIGFIEYEEPNTQLAIELKKPRVKPEALRIDAQRLTRQLSNAKEKLKQSIDYAFTTDCRFNYIMNYFGENRSDYKCGRCDNCTDIVRSKAPNDFIKEKVLETVQEMRKPVGLHLITKILLGSSKTLSEQNVSTYASCEHYSKEDISNSIYSLQSDDLLVSFDSTFGLSEKAKKMIVDIDEPIQPNETFDYDRILELFNKLQIVRKDAASKFSQPVNLICSDDILREIAKQQPKSKSELMNIDGFNQRMYNKLGEELIEIICEYSSEEKNEVEQIRIPENISSTLALVEKGYSLVDISKLTKLPSAVVSMQIETLMGYRSDINISNLFEKNKIKQIMVIIQQNPDANLKDLKELLPNSISYAEIRIVKAKISG